MLITYFEVSNWNYIPENLRGVGEFHQFSADLMNVLCCDVRFAHNGTVHSDVYHDPVCGFTLVKLV
jgi:hypothetical protein